MDSARPQVRTHSSLLPALEMLCEFSSSIQDAQALDLMKKALAAGADPNGFYRSGGDVTAFSALSVVAERGKDLPEEKYQSLITAAKMLVEAGGSPLNHMDQVFVPRARRFNMDLLTMLAERENQGHPIRDYRGQSILHSLVMKDASFLDIPGSIPISWINAQRQSDLHTPLHVVWSAPLNSYGYRYQQLFISNMIHEQLWEKTKMLLGRGARLDIPDITGESLLDLIARRMKEEGWDPPTWRRSQSVWHEVIAQRLSRETIASTHHRSSPRL